MCNFLHTTIKTFNNFGHSQIINIYKFRFEFACTGTFVSSHTNHSVIYNQSFILSLKIIGRCVN